MKGLTPAKAFAILTLTYVVIETIWIWNITQ